MFVLSEGFEFDTVSSEAVTGVVSTTVLEGRGEAVFAGEAVCLVREGADWGQKHFKIYVNVLT